LGRLTLQFWLVDLLSDGGGGDGGGADVKRGTDDWLPRCNCGRVICRLCYWHLVIDGQGTEDVFWW